MKSDQQIAKELGQLPKPIAEPKPDPATNRVCSCGRKIGDGDTYYIRVEQGEMPEILCDWCIEVV